MSQNEPGKERRLRVFLCHAHEDREAVYTLYQRLKHDNFQPWMDKHDLLPGQDWEREIPRAVKQSDVVLACISSRFLTKAGYGQKEILLALKTAEEQPDGTIFVIPLRLEDCAVPDRLYRLHWCNYFEEDGHAFLLRALHHRAAQLGIGTSPPAPPPPQPQIISVAAGSDLIQVVNNAPPGSTLRLAASVYRLPKPLDITRPLSLVGEGMDKTYLFCESESHVVRFDGTGPFVLHDLTVEHRGNAWARVVQVEKGEIDFCRCRFTGGVWDDTNKQGGTGLWLKGTTAGLVQACVAVANGTQGISVSDQAQPLLEANTCQGNKSCGIAYFESSGGTARQNMCSTNGMNGIQVSEQAQPLLEANTCQGNKQSGIAYFESSGGTARQNMCNANGGHGIYVSGQAQPLLEANTCQGNTAIGIFYTGSSGGTARQNTCSTNVGCGIEAQEQAQPLLEANTCQGNTIGIAFFGSSGGTARQNTCSTNGMHGIYVADQAQPLLETNICQGNKSCGIAFFGSSGGTARQNMCNTNGQHGIGFQEQAQPLLEANTCQKNGMHGIYVESSAHPTLTNNQCTGNKDKDVYIEKSFWKKLLR